MTPASETVVLSLPDSTLDDLIADLEAAWKRGSIEPVTQAIDAPEPTSHAPADRRRARRCEPHEFKGNLRLAVAGFPMRLVNLSSSGVLAETGQRLCPGRTVDVFLRYGGVRRVLRATVIRSSMHALTPTPVFRTALQFEDLLALQDTDL
jgi:hypothetical protein